MKQLLVNPENLHYWLTLKLTGPTDWAKLYNGYEATVDFPCYPWYGAYEIILWCKNYSNSKTF
jgi:hypothetical protein